MKSILADRPTASKNADQAQLTWYSELGKIITPHDKSLDVRFIFCRYRWPALPRATLPAKFSSVKTQPDTFLCVRKPQRSRPTLAANDSCTIRINCISQLRLFRRLHSTSLSCHK